MCPRIMFTHKHQKQHHVLYNSKCNGLVQDADGINIAIIFKLTFCALIDVPQVKSLKDQQVPHVWPKAFLQPSSVKVCLPVFVSILTGMSMMWLWTNAEMHVHTHLKLSKTSKCSRGHVLRSVELWFQYCGSSTVITSGALLSFALLLCFYSSFMFQQLTIST